MEGDQSDKVNEILFVQDFLILSLTKASFAKKTHVIDDIGEEFLTDEPLILTTTMLPSWSTWLLRAP